MSAEHAVEIVADAVATIEGARVGLIDEDLRSGGWFFDVALRGRAYFVTVVEAEGADQ